MQVGARVRRIPPLLIFNSTSESECTEILLWRDSWGHVEKTDLPPMAINPTVNVPRTVVPKPQLLAAALRDG